jgi:3-oxo-5alpha-steroid 4-dehydrogenase
MGKFDELLHPIEKPPFYAVNCDIDNWKFITPAITLGGLKVDYATGRVVDGASRPIEGLYTAGRSAVGICSNSYVTGLAIGDCVFSGRNAGKHAATAARREAERA